MIKFKIKNSDTIIVLSKGKFHLDNCDILINWISSEIITGPDCYMKLLKDAGDQFFFNLQTYKNFINYGDTFTTHTGLLPSTIAINCVTPFIKAMYNDCFYRIKNTIEVYSKNNLSRFITTTIPDSNFYEFIYYFDTYLKNLNFVREFRIIVENDEQYKKLEKELKKKYKVKESFFKKIIKIFE